MSPHERDSGFTMIELLVTISLLGIMMAIAVSGWSSWTKARQLTGAADELQSHLRDTQQRAVTEGHAMCVKFTTGVVSSYSVYSGTCAAGTMVDGPFRVDSGNVRLQSASFTGGSPPVAGQSAVEFTSRGSGWPGSVTVARTGSSPSYTVRVEVLTGHVSLTKN